MLLLIKNVLKDKFQVELLVFLKINTICIQVLVREQHIRRDKQHLAQALLALAVFYAIWHGQENENASVINLLILSLLLITF